MTSADRNHAKTAGFDRANATVASIVFLIALVVYFLTKAPTFSFWDCGEFVACSHILGIPHPPGSPLYILIGRIFAALPLASDIAVRVNLLSVISSAFVALFTYLVAVRLIRHWFHDPGTAYNRIIAYVGGFTGALFMAFSDTNWGNSVEAEVYAPAMLAMMLIYWLVLKYYDCRETTRGSKLMLLALYIGILGVGIHLTLFIVIPVLGLYFILKKNAGTREWAIVSLFFLAEIYLIFFLSSRSGEIPFYMPSIILFMFFLFHVVLTQKLSRPV
ncbi:MAG: DUF2723 domain-containing protein, partial [Candidatus Zixiibacteriota bacterium]